MKPAPLNKARAPGKPAWAAWYGTARWKALRADQLKREPNCRMCAADGVKTRAVVADHITPHRGNAVLFWSGPFQSLCSHHHNAAKQRIERLGYSPAIGDDGLPTDPNHPFNRG